MSQQLRDLIKQWSLDPVLFVEEELKVHPKYGGRGLSGQQREALRELGKLVNAKIDYNFKVQRFLANQTWDDADVQHKAVMEYAEEHIDADIVYYAKKRGISIMSGQGTGKDAFAAWAILWFLVCFVNPKIPCTAPTAHQLNDILWAEISKWLRNSHNAKDGKYIESLVDEILEWQKTKVFLKERGGKEWFALARTANTKASAEDQAETLAGFHEDYQMFVVDEASGVPDPVFKPLEGTMTGLCNFALIIFNPTRTSGFALETQTKERSQWIALRWNAEESENVSKEHIEFMRNKYVREGDPQESNIYRIRVLGLPPKSEEGKLIPWDWIDAAASPERRALIKENLDDFDPVKMGIDVGAGGDTTELCERKGGLVYPFLTYKSEDTMKTARWLMGHIADEDPDEVTMDMVGLGKGAYDKMREDGVRVKGINVRNNAFDEGQFFQLRDQLSWRMREAFQNGLIAIPDDDELKEQLGEPTFDDNKGRIQVESKRRMKSRGVSSPNKFDALMLTFYSEDRVLRYGKREEEDPYEKAFRKKESGGTDVSWMGI
jgi:hypothetical protein